MKLPGGGLMLATVLPVLLVSACTETEHLPGRLGRARLVLHSSPYDTPWERVTVLRLTLERDGEPLSVEFDPESAEVEIPGTAGEQPSRLLLEGLDIDGQVVAAGRSPYFIASSDQVTDVTIFFASTGRLVRLAADLLVPRFAHRLAELDDGRLLVVGGASGGTPDQPGQLATAEIYDPLSGGGCRAGAVDCLAEQEGLKRVFHNLAGAPGGKQLLFGGLDDSGAVAETIWLFDPARGDFRQFTNYDAQLVQPGWQHAQVLLTGQNDRRQLLLAGGWREGPGGAAPSARVLVFDLAAETFTHSDLQLSAPRTEICAVALGSGRALLAGGFDGTATSAMLEQFDGTAVVPWQDAGGTLELRRARAGAQCARLGDGRVLLLGGYDDFGASIDEVELFETETVNLQQVGVAGIDEPGRELALLVEDEQGGLLLAGGRRGDGFTNRALDDLYRIGGGDEQAPRVLAAEHLPRGLAAMAGLRLSTGGLVLSGGYCSSCPERRARAEVWYYQP